MALFLWPTFAHADGAFRTVLVIDASSSMKRTDPSDLRKVAAELYVDLARAGDRIAVTGFDENTRQSTGGFTTIDGPASRQALKDAIRAVGNDGKWTDFTAGLTEAGRLLSSEPAGPGDQSLVVFLTDGRCEPDPNGPLAESATTSETRTELCKELTLGRVASSLGGARVYAIGLSKNAPAAFLDELGRRTGGQGMVTQEPRDLPQLFAGVYARLLGSQLQEGDIERQASFEVFDGAQSLDVVIVGRADRSALVRDPSGAEIAIDNREPAKVYFAAAKEYRFYKVRTPRPGTWTVALAGDDPHRLAILQHFDLDVALVDPPIAVERGESVHLRGRPASAEGAMPPADFLARHAMSAVIGARGGDKVIEMTLAADGTFAVEYTPEDLGELPLGLSLEPKSGGVLSRSRRALATLEVIPPVYLRAQPVRCAPVKQRAACSVALDLSGSDVGVPLELSFALGPGEAGAEAPVGVTLSPQKATLAPGAPAVFTLSIAVADRAPAGERALSLTVTPVSPAGFGDRAVTVPLVVPVVALGFWERHGTWITRGAAGLLALIALLGFIAPAGFKKRAIVYYADVRDPEMVRRSSYPIGAKVKRGFYRAAEVGLGPSGPVKKRGAVRLRARSGGGIDAAPAVEGAAVYRVDVPTAEDDDSALVSSLEPDERPRVSLTKDGRFRMSAGVGYEVAGSGLVFWYK